MAYITPTNSKWVTWYDVSQALQERTGDYTQDNTQYATKAYIIANFNNIHLEKLNTVKNSIGISYMTNQLVKWADVEAVEYVFSTDSTLYNKDYYANTDTFTVYSYKNIYKNGVKIASEIPVPWHYNSSQTGWTTNTPTNGITSATTITLGIPENKTLSQITYNWSAIQNEGLTSGAKSLGIVIQQKAKYGTISWNPGDNISIVSTGTTIDKGIIVTGNFNDGISDSQGSDSENILTAVTINSSESWITGITFSLSNSNYKFPMWENETVDRVTTITLTINDPRLTLNGSSTFTITQRKRVVTFDTYHISLASTESNSFGNFGCLGGNRNYVIHSYARMYYDGTYQNTVNIPYVYVNLTWAIISNTSMEVYRSTYNSANGTGNGFVTVSESPIEGSTRNGNINFSQAPYYSSNIDVSVSQDKPCMIFHFDISPTSVTVPGSISGTTNISVTSYKVKNGHTESPITVGYAASTGFDWLTISGNSSPSNSATTNSIIYSQNLSVARNGTVNYTQNETNENGSIYSETLTVNQEAGFIYIYKFNINGEEIASSEANISLGTFNYAGTDSKNITIKSYAEVHIGSTSGAIDHYEPIGWSGNTCYWVNPSPSLGSGTSSPSETTNVTVTVNPQSESITDNARCCDIILLQDSSNKKANVNVCQERKQTGYTYTFVIDTNSLNFGACSPEAKTAVVTSYRDKTVNGVNVGERTNIGYSVNTASWVIATSDSNPSTSSTTTTITSDANSNSTVSRGGTFIYTQSESNNTAEINVSQNGATCSAYDRGPLQVNIGDGYTTTASRSVGSGTTVINVDFSSPKYNSLCGISSNTKCPDTIESYAVSSKPSWISSNIGTSYATVSDVLTVNASDVSSVRSGTVVYTNGFTTASVSVSQAQGVSYTYYFKVKTTSSTKISPNYETGNSSSFSNSGGSDTFTVESYRINDFTTNKEPITWNADGSPSVISYTTSGTDGTNNASISIGENTSVSVVSGYVLYTQSNSGYSVRIPVSQNGATIDCFLGVLHDSAMDTDINGGTKNLSVNSYTTINGKQGANSPWTASITGCGTLSKTTGPGGNSSESVNTFVLTIPSGITDCSGTITVTNACGKSSGSISYSRSAGDVKWSDPAENTTKSVTFAGTTFTAFADTTGLTADQCQVDYSPTSDIKVSTLYGSGTGVKAVKVDIEVPANSSVNSRSWDLTISPK